MNIDPDRMILAGLRFRLGVEHAITRSIALRAYADAMEQLGWGELVQGVKLPRALWDPPPFNVSLGFGPVYTF
jgi:hypothetical protein